MMLGGILLRQDVMELRQHVLRLQALALIRAGVELEHSQKELVELILADVQVNAEKLKSYTKSMEQIAKEKAKVGPASVVDREAGSDGTGT